MYESLTDGGDTDWWTGHAQLISTPRKNPQFILAVLQRVSHREEMTKIREKKGRIAFIKNGKLTKSWKFHVMSSRIFTLHNPGRKTWLSTGLMFSFRLIHSSPSSRDCMTKLSMGTDWNWAVDHNRRIPSELLLIERLVGGTSLATTGSASVVKY